MKAFSLANKLITTAVNGKNETRFLRIWFQLLPEMNDVRVNRAGVRIVLITPHRIQQTIAAERFRRVRDEVGKQRKFLRREFYSRAGAPHFIAANVNLDVA